MTDAELIERLNSIFWLLEDEGYHTMASNVKFAAVRIKTKAAKLENLIGGAETVLEAWDSGDEASFREAIEEMRADVEEAKGGKDE